MSSILEKQKKRFLFLDALYNSTGGNEMAIVSRDDIAHSAQIDPDEADTIVQYLHGENLAEPMTLDGGIRITHWGVVQVEEALTRPKEPTRYFPPVVNILNIQQVHGSQIQQGSSRSTQTYITQPPDLNAVSAFIQDFKHRLPELGFSAEDLEEAQAEVGTLEVQLASNRPKPAIIRESLHTIRNLLEGTAASTAASLLLPKLLHLLR